MKRFSLVALFSAAMLFFAISCGQRDTDDPSRLGEEEMGDQPQTQMEDQTMEENKFWTTDRDYTFEQKDQFKEDVETALAKLDSEIMALETEAQNATGETKEFYNEKINELKDQSTEIKSEMNEFANVNEENWEDFKDGIASTWTDVENSYEQLARETRTEQDKVY